MVKVTEIWNGTLKYPIILEIIGIGVVSFGIGVEFALKADIGYMLITAGSTMLAAGGLIFGKLLRKPNL